MEIIMTTGGTADALTINGIEISKLTAKQRREAWHKVCQFLDSQTQRPPLNELLQMLLALYAKDVYVAEPSEQCTDYIITQKLNIT